VSQKKLYLGIENSVGFTHNFSGTHCIKNSKNTNTKKSTGNWMRMFFTWVRAGDIDVKIEEVDPNELDLILQ